MSAEPAESATPRSTFISTAPVRVLLGPLEHGLGVRAPFLLITGGRGTGKSMLAAELLRRYGDRVEWAELAPPVPEPAGLATALLRLFGGSARDAQSPQLVLGRLLNVLANATAGGRVAILLVDDAHALTPAHLVELHRVAEAADRRQSPLELLLVGLPALEAMFDEPPLEDLKGRIAVRGELAALSPTDTREYLMQRPNSAGGPSSGLFSRKACRDIHSASLGVLADVEVLAAEAMRRALRDGAPLVGPSHVRAAANALRAARSGDAPFTPVPRQLRPAPAAVDTPAPSAAAEPGAAAAPKPEPRPAPPAAAAREGGSQQAPAMAARAGSPPAAARSDAGSAPPPDSNDPRVRDWVARFGGSGVSIGARAARRPIAEPDDPDDDATPASARSPQRRAKIVPLPVAQPLDEAALAEAVRKEEAIELFGRGADGRVDWRRGARATAPLPRRRKLRMPSSSLLTALALSVVALLFSQRQNLSRLLPHPGPPTAAPVLAPAVGGNGSTPASPVPPSAAARRPHTSHAKRAPRTPAPAAPAAPAAPVSSGPQYSIAVGSYPTRAMALAECDYWSRLVPMRVHVAPAGGGGYRLLLGRYDDVDAAEMAAEKLRRRGVLPDAKVVQVPHAALEAPARHRRR